MNRRFFLRFLPTSLLAIPAVAALNSDAAPNIEDEPLMDWRAIDAAMRKIEIPNGMHWYDIGGQKAFPMYSPSGALNSSVAAYLYFGRPDDFDGRAMPRGALRINKSVNGGIVALEFNADCTHTQVTAQINQAIGLLKYA